MLTLTEETISSIRSEGALTFPGECCGILLGQEDAVTGILPVQNARGQEARRRRFRIEADDLLRAEKIARERGLDVLGFYHSHPDAPASPSEYDREHALPFYLYLILSVRGGGAEELTAWRLALDRTEFKAAEYAIIGKDAR